MTEYLTNLMIYNDIYSNGIIIFGKNRTPTLRV